MDKSKVRVLQQRAVEIRDEQDTGENTANRVGGLLHAMIEYDSEQADAITELENRVDQISGEGGGQQGGGSSSGGDSVIISPTQSSGVKIADFSINGQEGALYAPKSEIIETGDTVEVVRDLTEGVPIAKVKVNGNSTQ